MHCTNSFKRFTVWRELLCASSSKFMSLHPHFKSPQRGIQQIQLRLLYRLEYVHKYMFVCMRAHKDRRASDAYSLFPPARCLVSNPPLSVWLNTHTHTHTDWVREREAQQGHLSVNHTVVLCTHLAYILNTFSLESKWKKRRRDLTLGVTETSHIKVIFRINNKNQIKQLPTINLYSISLGFIQLPLFSTAAILTRNHRWKHKCNVHTCLQHLESIWPEWLWIVLFFLN